MRARVVAFTALVAVAVSGCSLGESPRRAGHDPEFSRSINETATVAAVARRGAKVCREMRVGIAELDWVRGVVQEVNGSRVTIRIEEPGRFQHAIGATAVVRGTVVTDDATTWIPCR
jgi:hypothetical protein